MTLVGLASCVVAGCAGTNTVTERAAAGLPSSTSSTVAPEATARRLPSGTPAPNNPAQRANPQATVGCDEVPVGHACRATTTAPSDPNQSRQRNCDTNIVANAATSCGLAENAFYEYYRSGGAGDEESIMVHSPATGKDYELSCDRREGLVACTGSPLSTDIYTSFPQAAVDAYTPAQANAYERSRDIGHPGLPASKRIAESGSGSGVEPEAESPEPESAESEPSEEPSECTNGTYVNSSGNTVCRPEESESGPPPGATAECGDGTYSFSEHHSGTCSSHEGVRRWLQ